MLNLRSLRDPGVPTDGGTGLLNLAVKSLQGMLMKEETTRGLEKFEQQNKKIGIPGNTDDSEEIENYSQESLTKGTLNGQSQSEKKLRIISLDELAWHDTPGDCWFAIYDYVYDCSSFIKDHPGGEDVLLEYAGRDATLAFIGAGHSQFAKKTLERYLIGELPPNERIFRIPGGVKVYGC